MRKEEDGKREGGGEEGGRREPGSVDTCIINPASEQTFSGMHPLQ